MYLFSGTDWCGEYGCPGCPTCDTPENEIYLTEKEFWELRNAAKHNEEPSAEVMNELTRIARELAQRDAKAKQDYRR